MTQSMRHDFPDSLEREVVEGGFREGRAENPHVPGLFYVAVVLLLLFLAIGLLFKFIVYGFP